MRGMIIPTLFGGGFHTPNVLDYQTKTTIKLVLVIHSGHFSILLNFNFS